MGLFRRRLARRVWPRLLEAHRMRWAPGRRRWPHLRVYGSRFWDGMAETDRGWFGSYETAPRRWRALTFELGWWRVSLGYQTPAAEAGLNVSQSGAGGEHGG